MLTSGEKKGQIMIISIMYFRRKRVILFSDKCCERTKKKCWICFWVSLLGKGKLRKAAAWFSKLQHCNSSPLCSVCKIHWPSWKPSHPATMGSGWCENLTCCILFEDCINPQVTLNLVGKINIEQLSNTVQGRGHVHTRTVHTHKKKLVTPQWACAHTHTLSNGRTMDESWYQALFAARWGRGHTVGVL